MKEGLQENTKQMTNKTRLSCLHSRKCDRIIAREGVHDDQRGDGVHGVRPPRQSAHEGRSSALYARAACSIGRTGAHAKPHPASRLASADVYPFMQATIAAKHMMVSMPDFSLPLASADV